MKVPSFLSPYCDGDSPKRLFQGLAVGIIGTVAIGFGWGDWDRHDTVVQKMEVASQAAMVSALAPICAKRFEQAANADDSLIVDLKAVRAWEQDRHLMKTGWVTFPGGAEPDIGVAEACAILLNKTLDLSK